MAKKLITVMISFMIIFSLSSGIASAKTINNPDIIKVGLTSLKASSLSVTLEGHYKVNGMPTSDIALNFKVKDGKIEYKGSLYSEIYLEPTMSSSRVSATLSGKTNKYSGTIMLKVSSGSILPVNYIDMQSYLKGVLPYEISNSYPIEAIKSQAIASRTFALANLNKHKAEGINLCDTTNCQVYKGENSSYKNIEKSVDETENIVATYNGTLASITFGASNGGWTESAQNIWGSSYAYLSAVEDKYDKNPWPENKTYTTVDIDKLLKSKGYIGSSEKFLQIGKVVKNSSQRVSQMEVIYSDKSGSKKVKLLKKEEPRWVLGLRSMKFDVKQNNASTYTFSGSGYGHGVGMSQYGAKARAEAGQKSSEILGFYFPGTKIESIGTTGGEKPNLPPVNSGNLEPESPGKQEEPKGKIVARKGAKGSVVKILQSRLNYLGYSSGVSDGIFGSNTEKAVKAFQKKEALSQTGIVYDSVNNLLSKRVSEKSNTTTTESTIVAKNGSKGSVVKEIQTNLNKLGYSVGKIDSIYGKNTVNGVKAFQKAKGLKVTGVVDKVTYNALKNK